MRYFYEVHYKLMAESISHCVEPTPNGLFIRKFKLVDELVTWLLADNPDFDAGKFRRDCRGAKE